MIAPVSAGRRAAADGFAAAVGRELAGLAMKSAQVSFSVESHPDDPGPDGIDDVALLLAAHPGAPPRPVHRGASGGELSRVMLAIEVVFAGADPVPVMVFDEVDAGVGGQAESAGQSFSVAVPNGMELSVVAPCVARLSLAEAPAGRLSGAAVAGTSQARPTRRRPLHTLIFMTFAHLRFEMAEEESFDDGRAGSQAASMSCLMVVCRRMDCVKRAISQHMSWIFSLVPSTPSTSW